MLRKINYIFNKRQKIHFLFLLVAFVIGSGLELLGISAILPLVSVIVNPQIIEQDPRYAIAARILKADTAREFVVAACMALIAVYVIKNVYLLFMYYLQFRYTYNNKANIANDLMSIYVAQDYLTLIEHNIADLQRSISVDIELFFALVLALLNILCEGCTAILLMLYLLVSSPSVTLAMIAIMLIAGVSFIRFFKKRLEFIGEELRKLAALKGKWFLQTFNGIKEIKVLDREEYFEKHYRDANYAYANMGRKQNLNQMISRPIIETVSIGGLLAIIAVQILNGAPLQDYVAILSVFAVAAMRLLPSFNRIMSNCSSVMASLPALDALYNDMRRAEQMRKAKPKQQGEKIDLKNGITVENITFTYPHKAHPVLENVSLKIPANQSVAFIGPSGAGKTTIADIILGLMEPQQGKILAGDVDVYRNLAQWHKKIAYIPQTIYLMDDTIRANVLFGLSAAEADEERLWKAIRSAQLEEFVKSQPEGLESYVGDRGVKLSGGQRQRIGIARALYSDPDVLVLDEATSALDTDTETAVMEAIHHLQGKKTMIIIAHRLTTIRNCDIIYEVRDGKVCQKNRCDILFDQEVGGAQE